MERVQPGTMTKAIFLVGAVVIEILRVMEKTDLSAADLYQFREMADDLVGLIPQAWYDKCKELAGNAAGSIREMASKMKNWVTRAEH